MDWLIFLNIYIYISFANSDQHHILHGVETLYLCIFNVNFGSWELRNKVECVVRQEECGRARVSPAEIHNFNNNGRFFAWSLETTQTPEPVSPPTRCSVVPKPTTRRHKETTFWEFIPTVSWTFSCCKLSIIKYYVRI